jgi:glycerol uptake facilitator-like aquaporin
MQPPQAPAIDGPSAQRRRSKTLATWIAGLFGCLGVHRWYLHGWRDRWAWLYPAPTLLGLWGAQRMSQFGQDDRLAWLLVPILGLMLSQAMLTAIVYGLTPDEKWDARFHAGRRVTRSGWPVVIGVILALMVGSAVLLGTIAFAGQRFFEIQVERSRSAT